ncbi:protein RALF-like 4 [Abrus precatorius]|uniref:Protein RALF-like 4 n=1 Tax=Abrus precatorius TaxID=3816 RepID=A0A8B8KHR7_ABRPR|nr:protein RALF-like 4 [Abrus precatorius]
MGNFVLIIFFAMTLAMVSKSSESHTILHMGRKQFSSIPLPPICNGLLGECSHEEEMAMGSSISRRNLAQNGRYISYDALKKDSAPCNRRGNSYYDCQNRGKANPYRRGCSAITHCARSTD